MNQTCQVADVLQRRDLRSGKSNAESLFNRQYDSEVCKTVPAANLFGRQIRPRDQSIVVKDAAQDIGQFFIDVVHRE